MQIIINSGGSGSRLWPVSTKTKPKQFVALVDDETLLQKTYKRLRKNFDPNQIWVNTNHKFQELVENQLPSDFNRDKILVEPEKRDTFPAIVSHAAVVASKTSPDTPLVFVHADHYFPAEQDEVFGSALNQVGQAVLSDNFDLVTAGVKPTYPSTQFGYIQLDPSNYANSFEKAVKIVSFKEKPDEQQAREFLESQNYLWNLGYFSFTFNQLLNNIEKFNPELLDLVKGIYEDGFIDPVKFAQLPKAAFDYVVAEKSDSVGVLGIDLSWDDIGSWDAVSKYLPSLSENDNYFQIGGENNQVMSHDPNLKVAFVGVSDLLVVQTQDGILVVDPKHSKLTKSVSEYYDSKEV